MIQPLYVMKSNLNTARSEYRVDDPSGDERYVHDEEGIKDLDGVEHGLARLAGRPASVIRRV